MLLVGISVSSRAWADASHEHRIVGPHLAATVHAASHATVESAMDATDRGVVVEFVAKSATRTAALLSQSLRQGDPAAADNCGMMNCDCSMACNGAALVPFSLSVPLAAMGSPSLIRSDPLFRGLAPEALPKPPKYQS